MNVPSQCIAAIAGTSIALYTWILDKVKIVSENLRRKITFMNEVDGQHVLKCHERSAAAGS